MKPLLLFTLITILVCLLIFSGVWGWVCLSKNKSTYNKSYYKCNNRNPGSLLDTLLTTNNWSRIKDNSGELYLPCTYTYVESELKSLKPHSNQKIYAVDGCDKIVAKNSLWDILLKHYSRTFVTQLMPETFILRNCGDIQRLQQSFKPHQLYILKKNVQRQLGLKLTNTLSEILRARKEGYVIAQKLIINPYLINNRKFDIRVYLIVVCRNNKVEFYTHPGGRCHFTSVNFDPNSLDRNVHIPSGYTEDKHFKSTHPETNEELREYLNQKGRGRGDWLFDKITNLLRVCSQGFAGVLCTNNKFKNHTRFQLFGLDIIADANLQPFLIEVNKGPDMTWQTDKEKLYKTEITRDILNKVGLVTNQTNRLIPL